MKQFVVYIITLLLMMPPPALHKDSIVYDQNVKAHLEKAHENFHHKNDTEQDKTKKHHHHCSVELSVLTVDLPIKTVSKIAFFEIKKSKINYYKPFYRTSFIGGVFHPPKV